MLETKVADEDARSSAVSRQVAAFKTLVDADVSAERAMALSGLEAGMCEGQAGKTQPDPSINMPSRRPNRPGANILADCQGRTKVPVGYPREGWGPFSCLR